MKKIDQEFGKLCEEIDDLRYEVEYWKEKYEKLNKEHHNTLNQAIDNSRVVIGSMFNAILDSDSILNKGINSEK